MKKNTRHPAKPHGMNLAQTKQWEQQKFWELVEARAQQLLLERSQILQQEVIDSSFFAAQDMFGLGPDNCEEYGRLILLYLHDISAMVNEDGKYDEDIVYSKAKVDERMKEICGEKFDPWEVRYDQRRSNTNFDIMR